MRFVLYLRLQVRLIRLQCVWKLKSNGDYFEKWIRALGLWSGWAEPESGLIVIEKMLITTRITWWSQRSGKRYTCCTGPLQDTLVLRLSESESESRWDWESETLRERLESQFPVVYVWFWFCSTAQKACNKVCIVSYMLSFTSRDSAYILILLVYYCFQTKVLTGLHWICTHRFTVYYYYNLLTMGF